MQRGDQVREDSSKALKPARDEAGMEKSKVPVPMKRTQPCTKWFIYLLHNFIFQEMEIRMARH